MTQYGCEGLRMRYWARIVVLHCRRPTFTTLLPTLNEKQVSAVHINLPVVKIPVMHAQFSLHSDHCTPPASCQGETLMCTMPAQLFARGSRHYN